MISFRLFIRYLITGLILGIFIYGSAIAQEVYSINQILNNTQGFVIYDASQSSLIQDVFASGDINNDSYDDFIIVSRDSVNDIPSAGKIIIVYGYSGIQNQNDINFSDIQTLESTVINGFEPYANYNDITTGDINNDGIDDLIIGNHSTGGNPEEIHGKVYVIFGKSNMPNTIDLSEISSELGFKLVDNKRNSFLGFSVKVGDINNDNIYDIIMGAPIGDERYNSSNEQIFSPGVVYVYYGRSSSFPALVELNELSKSEGFKILGPGSSSDQVPVNGGGTGYSYFTGYSVGSGDIDGDNLSDLIIGSRYAEYEGKTEIGLVSILYGSSSIDTMYQISDTNDVRITKIYGMSEFDLNGTAVSTGDVNGDGLDDLTISATGVSQVEPQDDGEVYVIFGNKNGLGETYDLATLNGLNGFTVKVANEEDILGSDLKNLDINFDGFDEIIISAPRADRELADFGHLYILKGKAEYNMEIVLSDFQNVDGSLIYGPNTSSNLATAFDIGDINGDNLFDLILRYENRDTVMMAVVFGADELLTSNKADYNYPSEFHLEQNYPNPFNPTTVINYSLERTSRVKLTIYDIIGRELDTLVNKEHSPGRYSIKFSAKEYPSGIYFYRLDVGTNSTIKKMTFLK